MNPTAIVYTSNTGYTRQYARLLGEQIGLPVYSLEEANSQLSGGSPVIYLGWIHASHVKGYSKAAKRFAVCAVCGVGLCDTGTLTSEVRTAICIVNTFLCVLSIAQYVFGNRGTVVAVLVSSSRDCLLVPIPV